MDEMALSILAGAAEGANNTVQNLYKIGVMEEKQKREDELFKLKKRALDTDIKFKEAQYGEDAMELERAFKKAQIKKIEAESEAKKTAIKQAKAEERQALNFFTTYFPDVVGDITGQGGVTSAPRGSGLTGAPPEVPEGLEAELPWLKYKKPKEKTDPKEEIIRKIAAGTQLNEGEQQIYDDIIKKRGSAGKYLNVFPPQKTPTKKEGWGFGSKMVPKWNEATQKVASNIMTWEDIEDLIDNKDYYQEQDVDVQAILDWLDEKMYVQE